MEGSRYHPGAMSPPAHVPPPGGPSRRVRLLGRLGRMAAAGAVLLALSLALPACGSSKSYHFPLVRIDATVNQDGSLSIVERRTFAFEGHFSFAFFTVEHKAFDDVVDFQVSENGQAFTEGDTESPGAVRYEDDVLEGPGGFKFKATWWFDAQDEERTFTFSYRVLCAADLYSDTAHLLWKFVGEGWSVPTDRVVVSVHLPGAADPVPPRPVGVATRGSRSRPRPGRSPPPRSPSPRSGPGDTVRSRARSGSPPRRRSFWTRPTSVRGRSSRGACCSHDPSCRPCPT